MRIEHEPCVYICVYMEHVLCACEALLAYGACVDVCAHGAMPLMP